MAFCSNCGTQITDGSRFCPGCGSPTGVATAVHQEAPAVGMRTTDEILRFFVTGLKMKEKYTERYRTGVDMIVHDLMPGEVVEFATCAVLNFSSNGGTQVCVATTNRRMIIAHTPSSAKSINNALKGRGTMRGVQAYNYAQVSGINYNKGLLLGTVDVDFVDGRMSFGVDKPFVEAVYQGLRNSIYKHSS